MNVVLHGNLHSYTNLLHVLYLQKCSIHEVSMFSNRWHRLWCRYKPHCALSFPRYNETCPSVTKSPAFSNVHFIVMNYCQSGHTNGMGSSPELGSASKYTV